MADFDYGDSFAEFGGEPEEKERISEADIKRLEAIADHYRGMEERLRMKLRRLDAEISIAKEHKTPLPTHKIIFQNPIVLEGEDVKAYTMLKDRLLSTNVMSGKEFAAEVVRHGMRSMISLQNGNRMMAVMSASMIAHMPEVLQKKVSADMIRKGLEEFDKRQEAILMEDMEDGRAPSAAEKVGN